MLFTLNYSYYFNSDCVAIIIGVVNGVSCVLLEGVRILKIVDPFMFFYFQSLKMFQVLK